MVPINFIVPEEGDLCPLLELLDDLKHKLKTESISKLSNFNFQWTKTLYQNNLKHVEFFFTFFKGYIDAISFL